MCSIHPDKPLELYCKEDKLLICLGCAVVQHRNHQYDFISQIAEQQKKEIQCTLPAFREKLQHIRQVAADVSLMQEKIQIRKEENINHVNKVFQEITTALRKRKQQLLDDINKTTDDRVKALSEQHKELCNLYTQMNSYLELVELKLKSEKDRAIVAMKDQIVNRGKALLNVVKSTRGSAVKTVPPKVEFLCLQNVIDLVRLLGVSFSSETCTLAEVTKRSYFESIPHESSKLTFRVTVKDTSGWPVLNCSSLLDVKIFPTWDAQDTHKGKCNVEQPKVTDKGNGCYEFSTTCYNTQCTSTYRGYDSYGYYRSEQQNYGAVCVQIFGKDVLNSPLK